jgi:hypothetical protein
VFIDLNPSETGKPSFLAITDNNQMSRRAGTERTIGSSTILWDVPPAVVIISDPRDHHEESLPKFADTFNNILNGRNLNKVAIVRNFLPEFRQAFSEFPTSEDIIFFFLQKDRYLILHIEKTTIQNAKIK